MCTSLQSNRGNKRDKDNKRVVGATRAVLVVVVVFIILLGKHTLPSFYREP